MPIRRPEFTPEQLETLREFADHVRSGKHLLVFVFKVTAAVGALAAAVLAWYAVYPHH